MSKSPICEALKYYNELPDKTKVKDKDKFKSTVNKYYKSKYKLDPGWGGEEKKDGETDDENGENKDKMALIKSF